MDEVLALALESPLPTPASDQTEVIAAVPPAEIPTSLPSRQ